jgi:hypothetical protein
MTSGATTRHECFIESGGTMDHGAYFQTAATVLTFQHRSCMSVKPTSRPAKHPGWFDKRPDGDRARASTSDAI